VVPRSMPTMYLAANENLLFKPHICCVTVDKPL
jgi:hypothetical protein